MRNFAFYEMNGNMETTFSDCYFVSRMIICNFLFSQISNHGTVLMSSITRGTPSGQLFLLLKLDTKSSWYILCQFGHLYIQAITLSQKVWVTCFSNQVPILQLPLIRTWKKKYASFPSKTLKINFLLRETNLD